MADRTLLFEIGCEEVPAKMLARALAELPAQATALFAKASLPHGDVNAIGTPRRLALVVHGLHDATAAVNEELVGPPVAIAFDADGKPTKAGVAFASKSGVAPEALRRGPATGPGAKKGEFALATKVVAAKPTAELLPALLAQLIGGIAWPKSQRWGWGDATFVRPLQWLCALYGADVVPVSYAGVNAGRATRGHRFLSSGDLALPDASAYVGALRAAFVIVDGAERRQLVEAELLRAAARTDPPNRSAPARWRSSRPACPCDRRGRPARPRPSSAGPSPGPWAGSARRWPSRPTRPRRRGGRSACPSRPATRGTRRPRPTPDRPCRAAPPWSPP